ncbi:KTSC domain-containing protein [Clostridium estertheticum]|uniref:KTSC domain-containing protein n=1 Tax=Clostridium estertheticum TaxID=238834 RepID=UPI001CF15227|nr:KTSC domain-containing protein [Clostridium estertheticum]MCB2356421.1 KTSC domain-containing protein [Clostridium estertheticum]WAG39634.1 KTSC domain-containing protein [Clostridium estertheticum]
MSEVKMIPVSSSNIDSVGYDEEDQTVHVRFTNNSLYIYKGVPELEFDGLVNAPSVGSYLHRNYKNVYPYSRIE